MVFREFIEYTFQKLSSTSSVLSYVGAWTFRTIIWNQRPLSIMYDILSLTDSTPLSADMILLCTKNPVPNSLSFSFQQKNVYSPAGAVPLPSHLTSCTPTKSSLYLLDSSLINVSTEPTIYKLHMFHVPRSKSHVHILSLRPWTWTEVPYAVSLQYTILEFVIMLHYIYVSLRNPLYCLERLPGRTKVKIHCKIWGFHGSDYEEWCLLGCYTVWLL
jgi:hypothetical protein